MEKCIISIVSSTILPFTLLWLNHKHQLKHYEDKKEDLLWGASALKFLESADFIYTSKCSGELVGDRNNNVSVLRSHMQRCETFFNNNSSRTTDEDVGRLREFGFVWDNFMIPALQSEQEFSQGKKLPSYRQDFWNGFPVLKEMIGSQE